MAKRKLSSEQRTKLRAELAAGVKAGTRTPELLETIAKKYGITTITARWYLKSLGVKPKSRRGRPAGSKNGLANVDAIQTKAMESMQRAKKAKKLLPRWKKLVARKQELERESKRVEKLLQQVTKKADKLGEVVSALVL